MRIIPQNRYILRSTIVLAEVNELHDIHSFKITPYMKCKVLKPIYLQFIPRKLVVQQMLQISFINYQGHV